MQIDLVQLKTFVVAAEEQHLTRAAERLHISLSAASSHVRHVEDCLDMKLFIRANRHLELTSSGKLLLEKAKLLLNEAGVFTSFAREIKGKTEGILVIGASSESSSSGLSQVISHMRECHPLIGVDMRVRHSSSTRQAIKNGELDVGLILGRPIDTDFSYQQVDEVAFRVAGPSLWKEKIENANWHELARMPWLTTSDSNMAYSVLLREQFSKKGLELNSVAKFDNAAIGRSLLEAGVGLMLMREEHIHIGLQQGTLAVSPLIHQRIPILMAHMLNRKDDPLICAFQNAAHSIWPHLKTVRPNQD
jgi:DNA-binding transcriptional LysR family regulator